MSRLFLFPMMVSLLVFAVTWTVCKYIDALGLHRLTQTPQPRSRPVLSRPIVKRPRY
jgi:hypothetical protein